MEIAEDKHCSRCSEKLICKVDDIENCPCTTLAIDKSTAEFLATTFYDCLCKNCLEKVDENLKMAKHLELPIQKEMFIEGLHYYKENGNWVFTELYHILRGYCCQSGCRHCAYGFQNQKD